ncbi:proprotein convertase P-domain-containing protein [Litorimonas sp. RW-G-Af-16]|uniref:proprotein convertase P-domain-containing protein n=1 Tax=Litorimonas sp. RW-G-Af-16 TaxID=3241168 RepID=UPI003AAD3C69
MASYMKPISGQFSAHYTWFVRLLTTFMILIGFAQTASAQSFNSTATGQQIGPDATCNTANELNIPIVVSGLTSFGNVTLGVQLTHTYRGDIRLRLTSPQGTQTDLVTPNGGQGLDNYNIEIDDSAADVINTGAHTSADGTTVPAL